jgi:hypothetical protein
MSSVLRFYGQVAKPPTKFFDILTGSYNENVILSGYDIPIPFTVANQVLDINVAQSTDVESFVNNGSYPSTAVSFQGKIIGGASPVHSFGPSMTRWLNKHIQSVEGLPSEYNGPLSLYIQPLMTKIQLASPAYGVSPLNDEAVYGVTTEPPTGPEYIGGNATNDYFTAWVFKTPMTVQYVQSPGVYKYITLTTQFSAN